MTDFEKCKVNYKAALKVQNSYRTKAKRRFSKVFSAEELNGLTTKSDYNSVYFEKLNKYNIWKCDFFIFPILNSDRTKIVEIGFRSQNELFPELPQFISDKKQQILEIFTELYFNYLSDCKVLEENKLK